ncbi:MAG: ABC transporter permease [Actinomycetaceae bacterium]|nr:ABC transporter permease [Actinomycetaceae bacterium]MDY6083542.1 ABC transporter permease [Actinomycetaceae bacterium]
MKHVIRHEFTKILTSRSIKISTIIVVLLILIAGVLVRVFVYNPMQDEATGSGSDTQAPTYTIGLSSDSQELAAPLKQLSAGSPMSVTTGIDATPEDAVNKVDLYVTGNLDNLKLYSASSPDPGKDLVAAAAHLAILQESGAPSEQQVRQTAQLAALSVTEIGATDYQLFTNTGTFVGILGVSLMMFIIVMASQTLGAGIVEEKQNRIVEILLTTVRPRTLLLGKILGIGSAMLVVFAIYLLGAICALKISGFMNLLPGFSAADLWHYVPMLVVWIILGYFTYAGLTGAMAATVSRQEDLGAVSSPLLLLQVIAFYIAMYLAGPIPDAGVTKVLSIIPGFAPYLMGIRSAAGTVTAWEQILAVVVTLIVIPLLGVLAGKIYSASVLHTGERMKLTRIFRKAA